MSVIKLNLEKVQEAYHAKEENKAKNMVNIADEFETSKNTLYTWAKGQGLEKIKTIMLMMEKTDLSFEELFTKEAE